MRKRMIKERLKRTALCYSLTVLLLGMTLGGTVIGANAVDRISGRTYNEWFTSEPSAENEPENEQTENEQTEISEPQQSEESSQIKETEKEITEKNKETAKNNDNTVKQNETRKSEDITTSKTVSKTSTKKSTDSSKDNESYTITFNSNGGSAVKSQTVKDGKTPVNPKDPTRKGFKFEGWFKDAQFTEAVDFNSDKVADDVTVYAKWTPLAGTITHNITFSAAPGGGGSIVVNPSQAVAGEKIVITIVPDEGKIIKKGSLKVNGVVTEKLYFTMPDTDVTITAEFEPAPVKADNDKGINRIIIIAVIGIVLIVTTLLVITFAMREKPINNIEADWRDHSIVLSEFKKPKKNSQYDELGSDESEITDQTE